MPKENSKKILIAKVTSAHGIKGEVRVVAFCESLDDLKGLAFYDKNDNGIKLTFTKGSIAAGKKTKTDDFILIAKIDGIDDRNKAESSRDLEIFANRDDFKNLDDDVFYISDLIGMDVMQGGKKIAKVLNVFDFGADPMLEIEFLEGLAPKGYEKIENIAFKDEFFPVVDLDEGFVEMADIEVVQNRSVDEKV